MLKLYPPKWRKRYGAEFRALIAPQPFSITTVIDIIGGAIDAWTQPQSYPSPRAASHTEGDTIMLAKVMRLRCAGYGAKATMVDALKGAAVMLGVTILSVMVTLWLRRQPIDPAWARTMASSGWLIGFVLSMPYTTTRGWPARRQAIFIGVLLSFTVLATFGAVWFKTR